MTFRDENYAKNILSRISYYRLEGYWWDMQSDKTLHIFGKNACFEDVVDRYEFDKKLRLILFKAIESIEISLRTKLIYYMSLSYGSLWYENIDLFDSPDKHKEQEEKLVNDFMLSREIFAIDHINRYGNKKPEAWKIMEVASLGLLSKYYKNLRHQLPEKAKIANDFGLSLHNELSSWLEAIVYIRNIIAHHSRLWSRNMSKRPVFFLNNPTGKWLQKELGTSQKKKAFLIISTMIYLCKSLDQNHIRKELFSLFCEYPKLPIYKLGFTNGWEKHSLWK
jgi:abortive infection bacteriophage resistance protein